MNIISSVFAEYFYLRQTIPLFLYFFYFYFRDINNQILDLLVMTGLAAIGLGTTYFGLALIQGIPLKKLISLSWAYPSPINWGILFIIYYYILNQKEENPLTSFTLSTLAVVGGGWLYEVPFFHPFSMFIGHDTFFYFNCQFLCILVLISKLKKRKVKATMLIYSMLILCMFLSRSSFYYPNVQIICLLFLAYELKKRNFKTNRLIYAATILFMTFSTIAFLDNDYLMQTYNAVLNSWNIKGITINWIYRIPASLFLLSLLSGIKNRDDEKCMM